MYIHVHVRTSDYCPAMFIFAKVLISKIVINFFHLRKTMSRNSASHKISLGKKNTPYRYSFVCCEATRPRINLRGACTCCLTDYVIQFPRNLSTKVTFPRSTVRSFKILQEVYMTNCDQTVLIIESHLTSLLLNGN